MAAGDLAASAGSAVGRKGVWTDHSSPNVGGWRIRQDSRFSGANPVGHRLGGAGRPRRGEVASGTKSGPALRRRSRSVAFLPILFAWAALQDVPEGARLIPKSGTALRH